ALKTHIALNGCWMFSQLINNSIERHLLLPSPNRFPDPPGHLTSLNKQTLFALYGGGHLQGYSRFQTVNLSSRGVKFDDIIGFENKVYAVDRQGITKLVNCYKTIGKIKLGQTVVSHPVTPGSRRFGWRKRFAVDEGTLYLVVRTEEKLFDVFMLKSREKRRGKSYFYWDRVEGFKGKKYGNDGWEFTQIDNVRRCEDDVAVFRLDDERFARKGEGENSGFPKIDWSPPDWVFNVSSIPADEFQIHSESQSSGQSEREPDEEEGLGSDSGDKNGEVVESGLKDLKNKDMDEQEEMEYDFGRQDQDQEGVESDSGRQNQRGVDNDSGSQEKDEEEMHSKEANIEGGVTLPKDPVMPSLSAIEEEITRALLRMKSRNDAVAEETSGKNITEMIAKASTYSASESHKTDSATTKFEGLDIRFDLVPTLQKIWLKHGNITKDSIVRSGDIVARALESLATMVQILENNPVQSLSDSQAEYLSSTLSDLRSIRFRVCWLVSFVEKALKVHKSKDLVESLNNLSLLSSQVKERRAILLGELANLNEEENKLKEEMAKVSENIPFSGQVNFDEPIGAGLT
ncbi:hypothetical protein KSS87_021369, partial [Heliosperma pusillum]